MQAYQLHLSVHFDQHLTTHVAVVSTDGDQSQQRRRAVQGGPGDGQGHDLEAIGRREGVIPPPQHCTHEEQQGRGALSHPATRNPARLRPQDVPRH